MTPEMQQGLITCKTAAHAFVLQIYFSHDWPSVQGIPQRLPA